ncbi:MAG: nucleotidyltransferase domain-containing protein [Bacteroidia bacterium]|nr:nucleotidyltransferase domain-containing protein [Bacteroidia bacterium]
MAEEKVAYRTYEKIDHKAIAKKIKNYLAKDGRVTKAWLFGSFARDEDDFKSDIDLMIEVPPDLKFSLFDLADIQYYLEKLVVKKVDLVMSKGVKPHVMDRIRPDLKIVYER